MESINRTWPTDCFNWQSIQNMSLYNLMSSATVAYIFEDKRTIPIQQTQLCKPILVCKKQSFVKRHLHCYA